MDGKLLYYLGSSSDRSSDADFLAATVMELWDVLAGGNEIQMLSEFYADKEVAVGPAGTDKRNMMRSGASVVDLCPLRLLHCLCC